MYHGVCSFSSGGEHGAGGWTFEWSSWRHGASAHLSPLLDAMETWSLPPTGAVCFWPLGACGAELTGWLPRLHGASLKAGCLTSVPSLLLGCIVASSLFPVLTLFHSWSQRELQAWLLVSSRPQSTCPSLSVKPAFQVSSCVPKWPWSALASRSRSLTLHDLAPSPPVLAR
jgi:hypothetical protein